VFLGTGAIELGGAAGEHEQHHGRRRGVTPQCVATVPMFFSEIVTPKLGSVCSFGT
jgi:hypothetical protein